MRECYLWGNRRNCPKVSGTLNNPQRTEKKSGKRRGKGERVATPHYHLTARPPCRSLRLAGGDVMGEFAAGDVQALRRETGAGMMDAKRALVDAGGDGDRARELLRERGLADTRKRSGRPQAHGTIGYYLHRQDGRPVIGAMVSLACESDFVAKTEEFGQAADHLARHVAAVYSLWVDPSVAFPEVWGQSFYRPDEFDGTVGEYVASLAARMGEAISVAQFAAIGAGSEVVIIQAPEDPEVSP